MALLHGVTNLLKARNFGDVFALWGCLTVTIEPVDNLVDVGKELLPCGLIKIFLPTSIRVKIISHLIGVSFEGVSQLFHFKDVKVTSSESLLCLEVLSSNIW